MNAFQQDLYAQARAHPRVIVFPEHNDALVHEAATSLLSEGLVTPLLLPWPEALEALDAGDAHGLVAGSCTDSGDVLRNLLSYQNGTDRAFKHPAVARVSGVSVFTSPRAVRFYADVAAQVNPTLVELAETTILTNELVRTMGYLSDSVLLGHKTDGRTTQYDAALHPAIAAKKGFPRENPANVFIFPNIDAGNITYKAIQQTADEAGGNFHHMGPVYVGFRVVASDLSRGASLQEIIDTAVFASVLSFRQKK